MTWPLARGSTVQRGRDVDAADAERTCKPNELAELVEEYALRLLREGGIVLPMRFAIQTSDLWTGSHDNRRPLQALDKDENSHLHGRLEMCFGDRSVPHLGYFGPDDVCLGTWLEELAVVLARLSATEAGEHTFDEGEQGQPAFLFKREADVLRFSIVDSALSGARGNDDWQNVTADWREFEQAVRETMTSLGSQICEAAPEVGPIWWADLQKRIESRIGGGG